MANDETKTEEIDGREPETPLCLHCLQPVDPLTHFCPHCGEAAGRFTTYLPFESIPWETRIWGRMWRQLWSHKLSLPSRLLRLFMIVWAAPALLIGALFRRRRTTEPVDPDKKA